jgi:hypothetical protein
MKKIKNHRVENEQTPVHIYNLESGSKSALMSRRALLIDIANFFEQVFGH